MARIRLGQTLAVLVGVIAVLTALEALSMPVPDRKPALALVVTWFVLLSLHSAAYYFGGRIRERFSLGAYAAIQGSLVFAVAATRAIPPVTLAVFVAITVELVILAGASWGTIRITLGAIALYVAAALIASDLYRAISAGLILALTGAIAHAVAALVQRPSVPSPVPQVSEMPVPAPSAVNGSTLSAREIDVLRELVTGARNSDIATKLGITERTVKSHLGSIYQKLGVETRAAAVAAAVQRSLV